MEKILHNEYTGRTKERLARLLACGVFALSAVGCEGEEKDDPAPSLNGRPSSSAEWLPANAPNALSEYAIALIDDPAVDDWNAYSNATAIAGVFRDADKMLKRTTMGALSFADDFTVKHLEVTPTGWHDNEQCYTTEDLLTIDERLSGDGVAAVLNETAGCSEYANDDRLGAEGWAYSGTRTAIFGRNVTLRTNVIMHEIGHNFGLPHHTSITCSRAEETWEYVIGGSDATERLRNAVCAVPVANGKRDEYHSKQSVMGRGLGDRYHEVYDPLELAKIVPDKVSVPTVSNASAKYEIKSVGEGVRGITLEMPIGHPLHDIDPKIKTISFTAMQEIDGMGDAHLVRFGVTAASDKQLYDVNIAPPVTFCATDRLCSNDEDGSANQTIYVDRMLNVRVTAERTTQGIFRLQVQPID
jgi:hypothetical protein